MTRSILSDRPFQYMLHSAPSSHEPIRHLNVEQNLLCLPEGLSRCLSASTGTRLHGCCGGGPTVSRDKKRARRRSGNPGEKRKRSCLPASGPGDWWPTFGAGKGCPLSFQHKGKGAEKAAAVVVTTRRVAPPPLQRPSGTPRHHLCAPSASTWPHFSEQQLFQAFSSLRVQTCFRLQVGTHRNGRSTCIK